MENSDLIIGVLFVVALGLLCAWLLTLKMYKSEKKEVKKWVNRCDYNGKKFIEFEGLHAVALLEIRDLELQIDDLHSILERERASRAKDRADVANVKETEEDFDWSEMDLLIADDEDDEKDDAGD